MNNINNINYNFSCYHYGAYNVHNSVHTCKKMLDQLNLNMQIIQISSEHFHNFCKSYSKTNNCVIQNANYFFETVKKILVSADYIHTINAIYSKYNRHKLDQNFDIIKLILKLNKDDKLINDKYEQILNIFLNYENHSIYLYNTNNILPNFNLIISRFDYFIECLKMIYDKYSELFTTELQNKFYKLLCIIKKNYDTNNISKEYLNILQELLTKILDNKKFNPDHDTFMFSLVFDDYDNSMRIIKMPHIKIKEKTLKDYIEYLIYSNHIQKEISKLGIILNILLDNGANPKLIDQQLIINNIFGNVYIKRNSDKITLSQILRNNLNIIFNFMADNKVEYFDDLFEYTLKSGIKINNINNIGIDLKSNKFTNICMSNNFNPYNIEIKLTKDILFEECKKSGNLTKIKLICKEITPDIKCLEEACKIKNNIHVIKYLCDAQKIKPNIYCLINVCESIYQYGSNKWIFEEFKKDLEKIKKNEINIENKIDITKDNNTMNQNNLADTTNLKLVEDDSLPKKKVIRKVVKKKAETNTETNDDNNNEIKIEKSEDDSLPKKKVIRKIVKKKAETNTETNDDKDNNIKIIINKNKIIDINNYIIPKTYNYKNNYEITELGKIICEDDKINHIDFRYKILNHLKNNNKLLNDIELEGIKFKLNEIDKIIPAYFFKL